MSFKRSSKYRAEGGVESTDDDLKSFIASTEQTVRKVLKDQARKSEDEARRARYRRTKGNKKPEQHRVSREELASAYPTTAMVIRAPEDHGGLPKLQSPTNNSSPSKHRSRQLGKAGQLPNVKNKMRKGPSSAAKAKFINSPLFKSLGKSQTNKGFHKIMEETTALSQLLSPSRVPAKSFRAGHEVERRMCNACWSEPSKRTSCNHGITLGTKKVQNTLELQGPTSWTTIDLRIKYRDETERERIWIASNRLKEEAFELEQETGLPQVAPQVPRHPIYHKLYSMLEKEGRLMISLARQRNEKKVYVLNVERVWLTNLDHVDHINDPTIESSKGLQNRRDMKAIQEGKCQLPSVSDTRAFAQSVKMLEDVSYDLVEPDDVHASSDMSKAKPRVMKTNTYDYLPVSVEISGRADLVGQVPGTIPIGPRGLWWSCPIEVQEYTQAAAMFLRDQKLSQSKNVLVLLALALDTPDLSPLCFAWHPQATMPPRQIMTVPIQSAIPRTVAPKTTLLISPLETSLDHLVPETICLLNAAEQVDDYAPEDRPPIEGHRREWDDRNVNFFQQFLLVEGVMHDYDFESMPFGVTRAAATPNKTGTLGRFCWHSTQRCLEELCRRRLAKDYIYVILNRTLHGSNDPNCFILHMAHETIDKISPTGLSEYLAREEKRRIDEERKKELLDIEHKIEAGRAALDAKNAEKMRIEKQLNTKAALAEERLLGKHRIPVTAVEEWQERLKNSSVQRMWEDWEERRDRRTDVVFYHQMTDVDVFVNQWEAPEGWPFDVDEDENDEDDTSSTYSSSRPATRETQISNTSSAIDVDMDRIATTLARDKKFLKALKEKLGFETEDDDSDSFDDGASSIVSDTESERDKEEVLLDRYEELGGKSKRKGVPNLNLPRPKTGVSKPGEGWKRLRPSALPKDFKNRAYKTRTEGPRFDYLNKANNAAVAGMIDPADSDGFNPFNFITEFKTQFVADITADAERMQSQVVKKEGNTEVFERRFEDMEKEATDAEALQEYAAKAIVYTRNNNLPELEKMLDYNVDVNSRDQNGNTLFLITCQQGNKKIAKFLLRRGADVNAQNFSGNTALHYCYEYKSQTLAEYLIGKGADDTIMNAEGLTCYEGLSQSTLESL